MTYRHSREMTSETTARCVFCGARVIIDEGSADWYGNNRGAAHAVNTVYVCDRCKTEHESIQPDSWEV